MEATTLNALAEPNRLRIVELLRDEPLSVGQLVDRMGLSQPHVSKHLRVLREAGLVEVHAEAQQRIYTLRPQPFKELDAWLESYRHLWEARLDRLDSFLQELKSETEEDKDDRSE